MGKQRVLTKEDKRLAQRIKEIRGEKRMSQEELSNRIGANLSYIAYLETGRRGTATDHTLGHEWPGDFEIKRMGRD